MYRWRAGSSRVWTDRYSAAEIQWNYAKERHRRHHENINCPPSEDHRVLQEHRGPFLEHRANTIRVEYFGYLLPGISHRDREYNKVTQLSRETQSIRKLQSIGVPGGSMMLVKSVFFYIVMSLEAFIYCFVGEHLSMKVSINHTVMQILQCCPRDKNLSCISERNDRRCGVWIKMVWIESKSESRCPPHDTKIAEALEAHDRKSRGSFSQAICRRKKLAKCNESD